MAETFVDPVCGMTVDPPFSGEILVWCGLVDHGNQPDGWAHPISGSTTV